MNESEIIVDCIFGYNFQGEARGDYPKIIELINNSNKYILSIDVPSGFEVGNGATNYCIKPKEVLCISFPKKGIGEL